jgi:hypothetical protein
MAMILYVTKHTGINAHDNRSVYTRLPKPAAETDVYAVEVDLRNYSVGGPNDDSSMVFDASGHGYALVYDKDTRQITLTDSAGRQCLAVSGPQSLVA